MDRTLETLKNLLSTRCELQLSPSEMRMILAECAITSAGFTYNEKQWEKGVSFSGMPPCAADSLIAVDESNSRILVTRLDAMQSNPVPSSPTQTEVYGDSDRRVTIAEKRFAFQCIDRWQTKINQHFRREGMFSYKPVKTIPIAGSSSDLLQELQNGERGFIYTMPGFVGVAITGSERYKIVTLFDHEGPVGQSFEWSEAQDFLSSPDQFEQLLGKLRSGEYRRTQQLRTRRA